MTDGNGQDTNGHDPAVGGEGGVQPASDADVEALMLQANGRRRASLQIIQQAAVNRWKLDPKWYETLPKIAEEIASDKSAKKRDRLRALQVLRGMAKDSTEAAIALDRIERLDGGLPTENVHHEHQGEVGIRPVLEDPTSRDLIRQLEDRRDAVAKQQGNGEGNGQHPRPADP